MGLVVVADTPENFRKWWDHQLQAPAGRAPGEDTFQSNCGGCHAVRGTKAAGSLGPDLSHLMERTSLAAVTLPNSHADLGRWIADPQSIKPGNAMPDLRLSCGAMDADSSLSGKPDMTTGYERAPSFAENNARLGARLWQTWETKPGLKGFLGSVDHKDIGIRYILTAFAFLLLGGVEALIFRLQLSWSNLHLLTPEQYDQLFTMHGMTMIFLYAGPVLSGFSNYLWPLLLGARDMALPRLNALSYWVYLCAPGCSCTPPFCAASGPMTAGSTMCPMPPRAFNAGTI